MLFVSVLISLLLFSLHTPAWPSFPAEGLTARAAFLMDAPTGQVLYEREPDLPLPPASTSKIVTAILALESERPAKDLFTVTKTATRVPSSKLYLRAGQSMSIRDLLYSLLLSSANDASLVLAEGIAGSVERFAEMMTRKAHEIGAVNSRFANPHGLTAPGHYSTARDMALVFAYAMKNPTFREIVQTKSISVDSVVNGKTRSVRHIALRNHNRLLWSFDGAIGGKTGYTYAAQKCFVGAVSRDGVTLIVSVLASKDLWGDSRKLLEYGLENYRSLMPPSIMTAASPPNGDVSARRERPASPFLSSEEGRRHRAPYGYLLQVASFRERERAESLQKNILEAGYQAFLERAPLDSGETTYRVRVGPYAQLMHALEAAREIETKSGFRAIILPASSQVIKGEKSS